jgi:hypothetical protein
MSKGGKIMKSEFSFRKLVADSWSILLGIAITLGLVWLIKALLIRIF